MKLVKYCLALADRVTEDRCNKCWGEGAGDCSWHRKCKEDNLVEGGFEMKRVYIIHPFQGKEENRKKIDQICRAVANMGFLPISPVHAFGFLDDNIPEERELALRLCQELIKGCDQAWLFGDWEKSEGCKIEIQAAEEAGVPVVDQECNP